MEQGEYLCLPGRRNRENDSVSCHCKGVREG